MKTSKFFLLCLPLLLVIGCGVTTIGRTLSPYEDVNTLEDVWIEVQEGTVSPTGVTLTFYNDTEDRGYVRGSWYALDQSLNGRWHQVDPIGDIIFDAWGANIIPATEMEDYSENFNEYSYDWTVFYGELPPGQYRIVVRVVSGKKETLTIYYLTAEFQIS